MKIAAVKLIPITLPIHSPLHYTQGRISVFQRIIVELITDDGIQGYGECRGDAFRHTALEGIQGQLIGVDPYHLEKLRWMVAPQGLVELFQGTVAAHAYSAIEMACLDIIGKSTGRSVSDLLGGRLKDAVDMSAYVYYTDAEDSIVRTASDMLEQYGFQTIKYKCGVKDPVEEIAIAKALAKEFPTYKLRLDPNGAWGISTSVRVLSDLRDLRLEYLEDPVPSLTKLARIRDMNLGTPIGSNQAVSSLETIVLNEWIRAVDIPLIDVNWYGGLRASVTAARMAELLGLDVAVHSSMESAVSQTAQLHLAACLPNLVYASDTHYPHVAEDICTGGKLEIKKGQLAVPTGPGLGVEIDQKQLQKLHERWQKTGYVSWSPKGNGPVTLPRW